MKRSYLNWNRDSVNDEVIIKQLEELSKGQLKADMSVLKSTQTFIPRNSNTGAQHKDKKKHSGGGKRDGGGHKHHKSNNNNNQGGFKRKPF
jgi:hypothetical protein